jgi:hypothetical protein
MKIARRFRQQTQVRPTIAVEELVSRLRDTVIIDASSISTLRGFMAPSTAPASMYALATGKRICLVRGF